jgi:electron transfer flavoprotein beta subunit
MNIVVCIKQTFDSEAKIALASNGQIDNNGIHLIVNPYDEYAIEAGVQIKEKFGGEVVVVTIGNSRAQDALRTALAMGADRAILVNTQELDEIDEGVAAQLLSQTIATLPYDVILAGRVAIDDGSGQVPVRMAENLQIPSVTSIVTLEIAAGKANAIREIDGGAEEIEVTLPALFTAQKGLNEPRYPSAISIMKARKKKINVITVADLGLKDVDLKPEMRVEKYMTAPVRQTGRKLAGDTTQAVSELVKILQEDIKAF